MSTEPEPVATRRVQLPAAAPLLGCHRGGGDNIPARAASAACQRPPRPWALAAPLRRRPRRPARPPPDRQQLEGPQQSCSYPLASLSQCFELSPWHHGYYRNQVRLDGRAVGCELSPPGPGNSSGGPVGRHINKKDSPKTILLRHKPKCSPRLPPHPPAS